MAPFHNVESDEVDKRFAACVFPVVDDVLGGKGILKCWMGHFTTAREVLAIMTMSDRSLDGL